MSAGNIFVVFAFSFGIVYRLLSAGKGCLVRSTQSREDGARNHWLAVKLNRRMISLSVYLFFGHLRLHSGCLYLQLDFCIIEEISV